MRFFLGLSIASLVLTTASISDCSNGNSLFKIKSMSFLPDPPVLGTNSTLLLSMDVPEEISGGSVIYSVTYNFIPFSPTVEDLCLALSCPISVGQLDTISSIPFDSSLSGTLIFKIQWKDSIDRDLLCVNIKTKL